MKRIAVFVSGSGTNFDNISRYFSNSGEISVALMLCDNPDAGAIMRAQRLSIPCRVLTRRQIAEPGVLPAILNEYKIDFIVLAGFLSLVPAETVRLFERRIINIHPALLPLYGGRGMYGDRVHRAVIEAGEKMSGITIHYVNECYDEGAIIARYEIPVSSDDTPESLAAKIHALEYEHYPHIIERVVLQE